MFVMDKQLIKSYFSAGGSTHSLQHGPFLWISLQFCLIVYNLSVKWGKSVSKVDVSAPRDRTQHNLCIKALLGESCVYVQCMFTHMHFSWEYVNRTFVSGFNSKDRPMDQGQCERLFTWFLLLLLLMFYYHYYYKMYY